MAKRADCKSVVNDFGGSNPPPTKEEEYKSVLSFVLHSDFSRSSGFESRLLATCWMHVATGVAFPQKSESTTFHQRQSIERCSVFLYSQDLEKAFLFEGKVARRKP